MSIEINKDVLHAYGYNCTTNAELYQKIKADIFYLLTHNKEYTKEQYECIQELDELIHCFEEVQK